jgi:hypothetical protein
MLPWRRARRGALRAQLCSRMVVRVPAHKPQRTHSHITRVVNTQTKLMFQGTWSQHFTLLQLRVQQCCREHPPRRYTFTHSTHQRSLRLLLKTHCLRGGRRATRRETLPNRGARIRVSFDSGRGEASTRKAMGRSISCSTAALKSTVSV